MPRSEKRPSLALRVQRIVDDFHGGSVLAAAKRIGLPPRTLANIVKGLVTNPRVDALRQIAQAHSGFVSLEWLLTGQGQEPPRMHHGRPISGAGLAWYHQVDELLDGARWSPLYDEGWGLTRDEEKALLRLSLYDLILQEFFLLLDLEPRSDEGDESDGGEWARTSFHAIEGMASRIAAALERAVRRHGPDRVLDHLRLHLRDFVFGFGRGTRNTADEMVQGVMKDLGSRAEEQLRSDYQHHTMAKSELAQERAIAPKRPAVKAASPARTKSRRKKR